MNDWHVVAKKQKISGSLAKLQWQDIIIQLLSQRGFDSEELINSFLDINLDPKLTQTFTDNKEGAFYDPFLFRDMASAVELIINHIKAQNKIMIFGDYDVDGVTATTVLYQGLAILQAQVSAYLPDRVSEGYGLNKEALAEFKRQGVKLIITVDSGIRNKAEVAYAKELGLDIIISDHHVLPDDRAELPDCLIINPIDKEDNYPFPYLAGVGVAFKLLSAVLLRSNLEDKVKEQITFNTLDLVALGTVADMVSLKDENRLLVVKGLEVLNQKKRLGLNELFLLSKIKVDQEIKAWNLSWQLAPRLNAASRLGHANTAFALLQSKDRTEARNLAQELNQRNLKRQEITEEITNQIEASIDQTKVPDIIIGVASKDQDWNEGVIGLVAGRLADKYYRPTLVISRLKDGSYKGSGRSIPEFNLIENISLTNSYLAKYGGHAAACGFSIADTTNLARFQEAIKERAQVELADKELKPQLVIDLEIGLSDINLELVEQLSLLQPFGQDNPEPVFVSFAVPVIDIVTMGQESQHIKFRVGDFWALAFDGVKKYPEVKLGDKIDLVYTLDINKFNGLTEPQLRIKDLKLSK